MRQRLCSYVMLMLLSESGKQGSSWCSFMGRHFVTGSGSFFFGGVVLVISPCGDPSGGSTNKAPRTVGLHAFRDVY